MDVGIGLPNAVSGVDRKAIIEWARRAEGAGFSTLGTIDRIVYDNYEPFVSLAAAAAVTERIRLTTDILLAPLRTNLALFAKQAATLDSLSGGRLVLGLAVGGRQDDYDASGVDFRRRGAIFDEQLGELSRLLADGGNGSGIGPPAVQPGGPEILIGGGADAAYRRAAQHGAGWTMGGGTPEMLREGVGKLHEAWGQAGREGQPRTVALFYYALGEDAEDKAHAGVGKYYAFLGEMQGMVVDSVAKSEDMVKGYLQAFDEAGADEVICFPASTDIEDVGRLAAAAGL